MLNISQIETQKPFQVYSFLAFYWLVADRKCSVLIIGFYKNYFSNIPLAGYQTAKNSAVQLLTDSVSQYLKQFCTLLRLELDKRLEGAPTDINGWSDALENVCVEMRVGSKTLETQKYSVLALGEYYEDTVIKRHQGLVKNVQQMTAQYEAGKNIKELHVNRYSISNVLIA